MSDPIFGSGDSVCVRDAFPPGHIRTPYFIRGCNGVVTQCMGAYRNPEELAYGRDGAPDVPLYRVLFKQTDVWPHYDGGENDSIVIDIYEHWLELRT